MANIRKLKIIKIENQVGNNDEDWSIVSTSGNPDVEQNIPRFSSELSVPNSDVTSMFRQNILVGIITSS